MKRSGWVKLLFVATIVIAVSLSAWWYIARSDVQLQIGSHSYSLTIMRSDEELQKGLSGTDSLPKDHAMLFAFPYDNQWGIWMKQMKYPIDIMWLDGNGKVVYIVQNAQPSSYPKTIYAPTAPARYVVELPAGTVQNTKIKIGDLATLPAGV